MQPLLLTLDEGYLLTAAPPDLECGIAPLGPPAPAQPLLLGGGVASLAATPDLYKKDLHDQNNHDGVITHLDKDIKSHKTGRKGRDKRQSRPRVGNLHTEE